LTIRYSLPQAGAVQVVLYNAAGQQVLGRTLNAMAGMNQQQVQVPAISKGAYYLKVTDKEGKEIGAQQLIVK
ncbi:MAG: T9SS type A sorting domain-containing protein, partial [Candidatus Doudnabacteria bacterium]|nr:T9SS type A sorting domain-containing protein [Candidatus Doudnabacteria bacterium]